MRPRASTAVASIITSPAPPTARLPRCTRCQSDANPSTLEYWHMGDTAIRLRNVISRMVRGVNKCGVVSKSQYRCCSSVLRFFGSSVHRFFGSLVCENRFMVNCRVGLMVVAAGLVQAQGVVRSLSDVKFEQDADVKCLSSAVETDRKSTRLNSS